MVDPTISIIPTDDQEVGAEEELRAAVDLAVEDPLLVDEGVEDAPVPLGRSWDFDFQRGRFRRPGEVAPVETRGRETLAQWILTTLHTAAGAHPIFSPEYGMEDPEDVIGLADPREALSDWEERVEAALLSHDRIMAVENVELEWDQAEGIIYLRRLDINTDEEEALRLIDVTVTPEV